MLVRPSVRLFVSLSVRMYHRGPNWADVCQIFDTGDFYENSPTKSRFGQNRALYTNTCLLLNVAGDINLLEPELFFLNFSTPAYKMWIIQEPNTLKLWNKLHFEEEKPESIYHV